MAEEAPLAVNLKILSPSAEVEGGVQLADLPASTTIRELRQRIHDAAPSRPATDRMRLIYRGRVVANDSDTLLTVFGADNIRTSKDQSLHLVLRELPSDASAPSPAPQSASAPPNPLQPPPQSPLQTNPFRNLPEPRPNSQPQPHHHHRAHHHHHHPPPLVPLGPRAVPLPPHLQFAQHMRNPQPLPFAQPPLPPHIQQQFGQLRNSQTPPQAGTPTLDGGNQAQQGQPQPPMGLPNLPTGNHTRTVRQEGIGPNGERWTVTWNNTTNLAFNPNQQQPILPRPFPHPGPAFGLPPQRTPSPSLGNVSDQVLHRIRRTMEYARQEMENVRVLIQPPGGQAASVGALAAANPPAWRVDQIRVSVRNLITGLDNVDRGLASLVADPLMAQNRDFVSLQQSASDLRRQAEEFNRLLDQLPRSDTTGPTSPSSNANAQSTSTLVQDTAQSQTSNVPTELFILSSPQGPVGILFDQRGTYSTTPPTISFQLFSQQFNANRYQLGNLGRQIAVQNHLPRLPAHVLPPTGTPAAQGQQPAQNATPAQGQVQNQNANPAQPAAAAPVPGVQVNRVDNIAGHLWLIFKLAVFVYFFAGGGGWYRPLMICLIAGVVYIAQVGIFEEHFAAVREYLETLLPPGALGFPERVAAQQGQNRQNARAPGQHNQRAQPNRNPTPEQAARRLQQQHQDQRFGWVRETARTTERGFAMFVASLWPGIGERMVQAQEERVRAEREAEEARVIEEAARREEEQKKEQEAEESKQGEASGSSKRGYDEAEGAAEGTDNKGKGKKARVDEADGEVD
ncbi:hypothetical protein P171DRAFT_433239 [Karstenula rhodostoma CBS 690.94]|uniref:Ubiquitin-like domain-containing protein n=1 Tax=Karstenula rhodostoma CBS 690.94 TaxID=1392251 RepID=A0A9P4UAA7_9PLEO|nr:hypothetical protein P171DRAFT_433239 [Karstenula rhodostoma CBS 690.94]